MEKEKLNVKVVSHIRIENHVEYLINIENVNLGYNIFITEKYLNLRNLYESMKKEFKGKNFPQFPPNKLFGYEEENFVIQRAKDLNKFFQEINNNTNYNILPSYKNFLNLNIRRNSINNKNTKNPEINVVKLKISNKRMKMRSKLFNNKFTEYEVTDKNKRMNEEEFNNMKKEFLQIVKKTGEKFVNINYDIEINKNEKTEKKYDNLFNLNKEEMNSNEMIHINGDNNNFDLIGKNEDYIQTAENNIYFPSNIRCIKMLFEFIIILRQNYLNLSSLIKI